MKGVARGKRGIFSILEPRAMAWAGMFHPVGVGSTIDDPPSTIFAVARPGPGPELPPASGRTLGTGSSSAAFASRNLLAKSQGRTKCDAKVPLRCSPFGLRCCAMIKSFADALTEKIFRGDDLTKKEARQLGDIRIDKAQERLLILHHSAEKDLLTLHSLHYHKLHGTGRYSIDANSRNSKWRITFAWADQALTDVSLVKIEDTH